GGCKPLCTAGSQAAIRPRITGRIIGVEDPPPLRIDLVNVVAIPEWVGSVQSHDVGDLTPGRVRLRHVLAQAVSDIDPESVDSTIGPEADGVPEVSPHFLVLP